MHRTEGDDFTIEGGKNKFTDSAPGTKVEQDWLNATQEEICYVIEQEGLTLKTASTETSQQLYTAIISAIESQRAVLQADNIKLDGNTISTTSGNLTLDPDGASSVQVIGDCGVSGALVVTGTTTPTGGVAGDLTVNTGDINIPTGHLNITNGVSFKGTDVTHSVLTAESTIGGMTQIFDSGNDFTEALGRFTAPIAGRYSFTYTGHHPAIASGSALILYWSLNGATTDTQFYRVDGASNAQSIGGSIVYDLSASDYIEVHAIALVSITSLTSSVFCGTLLAY